MRGFVYRRWDPPTEPNEADDLFAWTAYVGIGHWSDAEGPRRIADAGVYPSQQEALAAVITWLSEAAKITKALTPRIVAHMERPLDLSAFRGEEQP